jgi:hypothetical protein
VSWDVLEKMMRARKWMFLVGECVWIVTSPPMPIYTGVVVVFAAFCVKSAHANPRLMT